MVTIEFTNPDESTIRYIATEEQLRKVFEDHRAKPPEIIYNEPMKPSDEEVWVRMYCAAIISARLVNAVDFANRGFGDYKKRFGGK